jgi:hypothetical protein
MVCFMFSIVYNDFIFERHDHAILEIGNIMIYKNIQFSYCTIKVSITKEILASGRYKAIFGKGHTALAHLLTEQANCMHGAFLSIDENVLSMWWSHFVPETTMWDISFSRMLPSTNKCYLFEYKGKI